VSLFSSFVERELITIEWLASGCCAVDSQCEVRSLLHRLRDNDSIQTVRELIAVSAAGESPFRKCLADFETHSPEDTDAGWIRPIYVFCFPSLRDACILSPCRGSQVSVGIRVRSALPSAFCAVP
jgi:hypothetical protein